MRLTTPPNASLGLLNQGLVSDSRSVDALRAMAARDPQAAVKDAAKQFEALFMQELMKSMRQASLASGMLDNAGSQMGTEMLDAQYASMMTGMPRGLSEAIERQLEKQASPPTGLEGFEGLEGRLERGTEDGIPELGLGAGLQHILGAKNPLAHGAGWPATAVLKSAPVAAVDPQGGALSRSSITQAEFVQQHTQAATEASAVTGIPASFMVAQAAHESGWGRREIKLPDGGNTFNVFGIKATPGWTGAVAEVTTTEYHNGRPLKVKAQFRAYDSYEAAFNDYAKLLKNSPRYSQVVQSGNTPESFAQGLQRAGYATDPGYADKLIRVIHATLRLQGMT